MHLSAYSAGVKTVTIHLSWAVNPSETLIEPVRKENNLEGNMVKAVGLKQFSNQF
jgi:hypothetical protein